MTVKFPLMFVVSFVATDISRTKGLFYAFNAMGGRNLKPKLDYKASKNGTSESLLPIRVETGQKSLYCGYNRSR